tara:strand:+ start:1110 stop:1493 length:384 start_codon:yes stop_codon:yes gene_type:complete
MVLSNILTNVRTIPQKRKEDIYENATWKKGYMAEKISNRNFQDNRVKRLTTAQGYSEVNISMPYIPPNKAVLNLRLVKENNVYDYVTKMNEIEREAKRFNYYDPVNQAPQPRGILYDTKSYGIGIME